MVHIYQLKTLNIGSNSHITARDQEWYFEKIADIDQSDLHNYIIDMSHKYTDLPIFKLQMIESNESQENINKFIQEFCFDENKYLKYKRFFIEKPNKTLISKIQKELNEIGINVKLIL